jgi:hypothetical protein
MNARLFRIAFPVALAFPAIPSTPGLTPQIGASNPILPPWLARRACSIRPLESTFPDLATDLGCRAAGACCLIFQKMSRQTCALDAVPAQ